MKAIEQLIERHPELSVCAEQIRKAFAAIVETYRNDGRLLCCGNGGSAADSEHIVGELMKGFLMKRELPCHEKEKFASLFDDGAAYTLTPAKENSIASVRCPSRPLSLK